MAGRLKFYGWGVENTGLDEAERDRLFRFIAGARRRTPPCRPAAGVRHQLACLPRRRPARLPACSRMIRTSGCFILTANPIPRPCALMPGISPMRPISSPSRRGSRHCAVLDWASGANVAVIPFGCGSSVVGGVEPDVGDPMPAHQPRSAPARPGHRGRCDKPGRAHPGGHPGPAIDAALKPHGLSIRHYPQSFEFSTLGGWIATRSGGHFATLYTHIDDFVESIRMVTPAGVMNRAACPARAPGRAPTA